ncbi:hypothetical protein [Pseudodesulfovibrio sediminis]|uniref:Uncharacterized protein n=1 Tax=Pseudodesulfovibrio sediminis TaxID=2810563 RepID=A0ABM8HWB3_9BACT|nr:hypothetical protein [Pseudodesulfovibrio sediminis]BCS86859.1 hypothetical protein PSDVSF_01010 [Pseudodesulfovibrio sediminis]
MSSTIEPGVNKTVVEQAMRHINHHGGIYEDWYVGIEEEGSDRDDTSNRQLIRYETASEDEAKLTMSWLLGLGFMADDEYGAEPTILFVYTNKKVQQD